ncbi:MAG: hypothetical protein ABIV06_05710 [Thermoanaerobaculia bacterium]
MSAPAFVFAVCGARPHFDRLAIAIAHHARHSRREILVVTDPARNRGVVPPLPADQIVAAATDPGLTDAEAAIELKTGLATLLPAGRLYAYLDSDVLAIGDEVDTIFDAFVPPVTFAPDLPMRGASLRTFSSHAIDCECAGERQRLTRFFDRLDDLTALHRQHNDLAPLSDPALYSRAAFTGERRGGKWWRGEARGASGDGGIRFEQRFEDGAPVGIVYRFAGTAWRFEQLGGEGGIWHDGDGTMRWVTDAGCCDGGYWQDEAGDSFRRKPSPAGDERLWFRAGAPRRRWQADPGSDAGGAWVDAHGRELGACDHLVDALERLFAITIADRQWVPWNGGVFLFTADAAGFFADWQTRCRTIFRTPGMRVRDQGALVASAWASALENHPRLPQRFNRIVDRRSPWGRDARLAVMQDHGAQLVHLIGGGIDDLSWPFAADLARARAGDRPGDRPGDPPSGPPGAQKT